MDLNDDNYLAHVGKGHKDGGHSGRYPWGSGDSPYQHASDFMARVNYLRKQGFKDTEIAESMGMLNEYKKPSTGILRNAYAIAKNQTRIENIARIKKLKDEGKTLKQIEAETGIADATIRSLLNERAEARTREAMKTAEFLKEKVAERGPVDVGKNIETELGISRVKLDQALQQLQYEGYEIYGRTIAQVNNPGKRTTLKILFPPGSEHKEIYDLENLATISDYQSVTTEKGESFKPKFVYPSSLDSSRLQVLYEEDGGTQRDGLIELRRGVQDLDLGKSNYAQVRIMVDGKKYLKGMAVYADDLPEGIDVRFNSNKPKAKGWENALKDIKDDPENPFGSLIKEGGQSYYVDKKTGEEKLSLINKRAEEGDWGEWKDYLSSQFLSKQSIPLIKKQLQLTQYDKKSEFDEIMTINNPTVKRSLLQSFADDCDASAVHLKAAALPRQKYQVLLPMPELKDGEIYAPNYKNGEKVALARYPFGGTFECPILTVNNNVKRGEEMMGKNPMDAIGIKPKTAEKMSGADFDGDTALVIPVSSRAKISSRDSLPELEGFDPKMEYGGKPEGSFKPMKKGSIQNEMGQVSNLITDMTLKGADDEELARAVKHSMVIIDAYKHKLDYKQSEKDNGIRELKLRYQGEMSPNGRITTGSSTLISRAKSPTRIAKRQGTAIIDPETGKVSYKQNPETYIDKDGKVKERTQTSTKMADTDDAFTLVSSKHTAQEVLYAEHANYLKALANQARKEMVHTERLAYNASSKKTYATEVQSLNDKLTESELNRPKERRAQILANSMVAAKKAQYPDMTKEEIKKENQRALTKARDAVGAKRVPIEITDKEWEAIQAGAITDSKLQNILKHADESRVRQLATPKSVTTLPQSKISRLESMLASGNYTNADIAKALGISTSTVNRYAKGE